MKIKKRWMASLMTAIMSVSTLFGAAEIRADSKADLNKPYIALGADLKADERAEVLKLLGVTESELKKYTVATVTNKMEHEYLDSYLSSAVIGSRALSSVKVIGKEKKSGVNVTTKNISYCTTGMYQNALVTAGLENADVTVAGPFRISGTAALVGAMEAYENMTGEIIQPQNAEAATNELVVTSELGEVIGDQDKAEELVGAVKDIIVGEEITDPEEIEEKIEDTAQKLEVTLSEEDKEELRELMEKISSLDLDANELKQQAQNLYEKLSKLDVDLDISTDQLDGFFAGLGNGFSELWNKIKNMIGL